MTVRYAAPGRINLIGEHTDYNLGFALPIALPRRTVASFTPADDDAITVVSDRADAPVRIPIDTGPGDVTGWAAYPAGVMWALRTAGHPVPGGAMSITSDVPMGSGLSSSAALECAVLGAISSPPGFASTPPNRPGWPSAPKTNTSAPQRVCSTSWPRCTAALPPRC